MGFRFYRSLRLGKFIRLNISKSGIGFSAGIPGLGVTTGPHGTHFYAGLPGTGLSFRKKISSSSGSKNASRKTETKTEAQEVEPTPPELPTPGFFASRPEKELAEGVKAYRADERTTALDHFLNAATEEPGAAILAAALLAERPGGEDQAIKMLERVVEYDGEFPTSLMDKYLADMEIEIDITPNVTVSVPVNGLAATLLLVELYQSKGRAAEAIGLLEEVEELVTDPILTLSLCELYALQGIWEGIIDRAKQIENEDNITLEIVILYGRAMQGKGLHEAAIEVFTKALRKTKDRSPHLLNEARYWRALSYEALGRRAQANRELQKLYADAPDFRDVARRLETYQLR
jgi:tetratricopeptide (TPR) repeat protein